MTPFHDLSFFSLLAALPVFAAAETKLRPTPLKTKVRKVQPMTGIVLWDTSPSRGSEAIQLSITIDRLVPGQVIGLDADLSD